MTCSQPRRRRTRQRKTARSRAGAPGIGPARFAVSVNDTIKCSRKTKRSSYESLVGRPSTVSREIRRNCTHMYDIPTNYPHTAQKKYLLRRSYCHRGMFRSQATIEYINEKRKAAWSPEQIACTPCSLKMPSWRTIYRWIYEKYLVKRSPATGERNLRTGARSSGGLAAKCILPIRTVRSKRARMKMQTACLERFIRKAEICRVLLLPL